MESSKVMFNNVAAMRSTRRVMSGLAPTIRGVFEASCSAASSSTTPSSSSTPATSSPSPSDEPTVVSGWIRSLRAHKKVAFAELDDGSGSTVQAVLKGKGRALVDEGLNPGSAVRMVGQLVASKGAGQALELVVEDAALLGSCDPEMYPIQKKALPASVLREQAHLRFKTSATAATMRVRDALARDWHDWFEVRPRERGEYGRRGEGKHWS